jgi:DNA-directed RNA polymerase specialized sigma24 family protein
MKLMRSNLKYCAHKYLIPNTLASRRSRQPAAVLLKDSRNASPFCLQCWNDPEVATVLQTMLFDRPAADDPCTYGFCDLIQSIARKRGFRRDGDQLESVEQDLRLHLIAQKATIEAALAGKTEEHRRNYIRRVLKNYLTNTQTSSEGIVARNSTKSLSPDGPKKTPWKHERKSIAEEALVELESDSAAQGDDHSLDPQKRTLEIDDTDAPSGKKKQPTTHLHGKFYEATSPIATLTGGRKDGFDIRLDLQRVLPLLSVDQKRVFTTRYLDENGELLNYPRTYSEVESILDLTPQTIRTLERQAREKLRSAL